jgi:protein associated with RNAse G/E
LDHCSSFNYINDSKPVLSADDTSLIIANPSPTDFKKDITTAFFQLNEWFNANSLLLNYEKTYYIYVMTKSSFFIDKVIHYSNKIITSASNTKFVQTVIENSLSWKAHID